MASAFYVLFRVVPSEAFRDPDVERYAIILVWVTDDAALETALRSWGIDLVERADVGRRVELDVPGGPRVIRAWSGAGEEIGSTLPRVTHEAFTVPERIFRVVDGVVVAAFDRTLSFDFSIENKDGPGGTYVDRAGVSLDAYFGGDGELDVVLAPAEALREAAR
ncbi:MAG TPA: hypothetical protein VI997_07300 [Candidatus Thermoplasmatota archaeon]|nr:hypothetical protein [Candidatus Thermoplasmatota archaeon]